MRSVIITGTKVPCAGELTFPGDKSLSHRAIIFGSLSEGTSAFSNVLAGEDCVCTRKAFESMGVEIRSSSPSELVIRGRGLGSLQTPASDLYLGNSGTSMRLLLGLLCGAGIGATLTGDPSLSGRPMRRVTDLLRAMGGEFEGRDGANFAPIRILPGRTLRGIDAVLPVASAQVKSAVLLAGLFASGITSVTEPVRSRDHTERFLKYFGAALTVDGTKVSLKGGQRLEARSFEIAGDISSAAFFMAIALLVPGSRIRFQKILNNPTRTGILDVIRRMGVLPEASISSETQGPEPVTDFTLTARPLKAFEIHKSELPALIDEIPILAVLATQAAGTSVIHDADELRVKETDRIRSMTEGLRKMGAQCRVEGNTLYIDGPTPLKGAEIDSFKDHRTAMSFIVAGLIASGRTVVRDVECIDTSFPNFFELLKKVGAGYESLTP